MSDTPKRKRAHVTSAFEDVGTGIRHSTGDTPMLDEGTFENYKAAGLVSDHAEDARSASSSSDGKSGGKS